MATNDENSIIHFPDVDKVDWISNNFLNSRGGRFVVPVSDSVREFTPVMRFELTDTEFAPCPEGYPALFVCSSIITQGGVRYGVIDCTIRTVKYTTLTKPINVSRTYSITVSSDHTDPSVTVTEASTGVLFRILDQNSVDKTITYINA